MDAWKIFNAIGVLLVISAVIYFSQTVFTPLSIEVKIIILFCFTAIVFLAGLVLKGRDN